MGAHRYGPDMGEVSLHAAEATTQDTTLATITPRIARPRLLDRPRRTSIAAARAVPGTSVKRYARQKLPPRSSATTSTVIIAAIATVRAGRSRHSSRACATKPPISSTTPAARA